MKLSFALLAGWLAWSPVAFADEAPKGFENASVLAAVMAGDVRIEELSNTSTGMHLIYRAFYKGSTPDRFVDAITDHSSYPQLFAECERARTTATNANRTQFDYALDLKVKFGILTKRLQIEGRQKVTAAPDLITEWVVTNEITNQREDLRKSFNTIRLIPYQGGFLVHADYDLQLVRASLISETVKKRMREEGLKQIEAFRRVLRAQP